MGKVTLPPNAQLAFEAAQVKKIFLSGQSFRV
jgi:hypothetical protein